MMTTKILPLSEGTFTVGQDKIFAEFDKDADELNKRATGSLLVEVQPFVVVNDRDVILLDLGLGFPAANGKNHIAENLEKHNLHPEDVTKVLLTHLHKDHSGGLDMNLFPNASYYIYKKEYESAQEIGFPSYYVDDLKVLEDSDKVVWLEESKGSIDNYIHYEHSGGHSQEHIVFWIDSEDGPIFFGGDEAPQLKQLRIKYVAKYDFDGKKAMELRKKWAEEGKEQNWTFLFYHDIKTPVSKM